MLSTEIIIMVIQRSLPITFKRKTKNIPMLIINPRVSKKTPKNVQINTVYITRRKASLLVNAGIQPLFLRAIRMRCHMARIPITTAATNGRNPGPGFWMLPISNRNEKKQTTPAMKSNNKVNPNSNCFIIKEPFFLSSVPTLLE